MAYKLLALDLDYTLLNDEQEISAANQEAIKKAVQQGTLVTLATGRMFQSTLAYARQLQLDLPLITYHGALIKKANGKETLRHCTVPRQMAEEILAFAREENYHVNLYLDDQLYVQEENENTRYYQTIADVKVTAVGPLEPFVGKAGSEPTKITLICRDERFSSMEAAVRKKFGSHLAILRSRPYFLELTHKEATKGKALEALAKPYGVRREEVAAIGDSQNDLDMLLYAGMGVAVANAAEEVKAAADFITLANNEDGVAYFINKYILKRGNFVEN